MFSKKGNEIYGHLPTDMIIHFEEIPHDKFKRSGSNLIYTHPINLADAI